MRTEFIIIYIPCALISVLYTHLLMKKADIVQITQMSYFVKYYTNKW